jgi:serine/threonine protein kinase/tetratricopeptide (TPR) repeat protein/TolB-like protein
MVTPDRSSDRWPRVKEILAAALDAGADRRQQLLDEQCGSDAALRADVEALLHAHAGASSFLEQPAIGAAAILTEDPYLGQRFGAYLIERPIGRGGMGTVYLARRADDAFERLAAVKTIRRGMDTEAVIGRFRHERRILASLAHPNIGALFDGGTTPDGLPYFVMEYVDGEPINRYADERRLSTRARLELCLPILDAVQHAHEHHVIHRDIKPGNVLVTRGGHPTLLDFGIAKILDPDVDGVTTLTAYGRPMTPDYASPEQLRGEAVTASTDVYALGVLLYELLTGHRPFGLALHSPEEMSRLVADRDPDRPSTAIARTEAVRLHDGSSADVTPDTVSAARESTPAALRRQLNGPLDEIVLKALRRDPAERYSTVAELARDLRRYLVEQPVRLSWDARRYRTRQFIRRHRATLAAAALVAAAATATAVITWRALDSARAGAVESRSAVSARPSELAHRPSLAVLGIRNLSARPGDEWLSTALAEMLTTELAGDGQLRVVPPERVARATRDVGGVLPASDVVDRLRRALASDHAVLGTFAVTDGPPPRSVRIDVRVHQSEGDPIAVAAAGDEAELFALVAKVGGDLRARLGLRERSPDAVTSAQAGYPQSLEAIRLYADGMARLRRLDAVAARDRLQQADTREPGNPLIQVGLASAWGALGYDARAAAAAQAAFDVSGSLNREDRLNVEGRLYEVQRKWPNAVDVYRTLWGFFADNIEYGLKLAAAQTAAGDAREALKTVEAMRRLQAPDNMDPRIDLEEAQASTALGDYPRESTAIQQAVARAEQVGSRLFIARARLLEGRSFFNRGELARAEVPLNRAHAIFVEVGDRAGAASALNALGNVLADRQDIKPAEQMFADSLAASEAIGDRRAMSAALNSLGILLKDTRRFDEARRAHERALALRREIADRNWIAISLSNIGVVFFEQDRLAAAAKQYRESLAIVRELGDQRGEVRALHNLAIVDRELGNLASARQGYEATLPIRDRIGDKRGGVAARVELGLVLLAQGELELARKAQTDALGLSREIPLKTGEGQALFQLAEIARAAGELPEARRLHEQALEIRRSLNETRTQFESRVALAELALDEGRPGDAERDARQLTGEAQPQFDRSRLVALHILTARARLALADPAGAARVRSGS